MKKKLSRREALRMMTVTAAAALVSCQKNPQSESPVAHQTDTPQPAKQTPTSPPTPTPQTEPTATDRNPQMQETQHQGAENMPTVLMTTDISANGLMKIYEALNHKPDGNSVAVKISSGEPGGHYFLSPDLIEPLVTAVNGNIVECNTAYGGGRSDTGSHQQAMENHGFTAIAPVDIMDAEGTINLPILGGVHLLEDVVGENLANYDFMVNLAHFKGHAMAGFGGVIKNMSIGIASKAGKCLIHTAGASSTSPWGGEQNAFLESMAEAAKGIADYMGENIIYINVMNNLSVDCDCDSHPATPTMEDIGILASLDPVAVDQACVDLVYAASDGKDLIARMESRNGILTLEHAAAIGLGSRQYELVNIG